MKWWLGLFLVACAARATPGPAVVSNSVPPPTPRVATWIDRCEQRLRRAADDLIAAGLPGPILTQRERPTNWAAWEYNTYVEAAATNHRLFPDDDPTRHTSTEADGLIFVIGRSMKFRVALVPVACEPHASRSRAWYDTQSTDPTELAEQVSGVSVTIHTDPSPEMGVLAAGFVEVVKPIVAACIAERPPIPVTITCSPDPG